MKVGILQSLSVNYAGFKKLKKATGKYRDYNITVYKEYFKNDVELRFTRVTNNLGKFIGSRLVHISNGRIINRIDRFV